MLCVRASVSLRSTTGGVEGEKEIWPWTIDIMTGF